MSLLTRLFKPKQQPAILDASNIIPVLRTSAPGANAPMYIPEDDRPIAEPFAADLLVCYAIDTPEMLRFISPSTCATLGVPLTELRARAVSNLERLIKRFEIRPITEFHWVSGARGHEATLLLNDSFWTQMREKLQADIIAAVPGREYLLFIRAGVPGLDGLLSGMIQDLYKESQAPLSTKLLLHSNGAWKEYQAA